MRRPSGPGSAGLPASPPCGPLQATGPHAARPISGGMLFFALLFSLFSLFSWSPTSASAQARALGAPFPPAPRPDVALDLHGGTLAPFLVGAGARVSLPAQLVVGVLFGGVPDPYGSVFADAAEAYGAGQGISELVGQLLSGAFTLRVEAGVRPVSREGLELLAHYTALMSEPELSTASVDQIAGQPLPWGGQTSLRLNGVLHGVGGEIGWAISPIAGFVLRLGLGLTYFAGASLRVGVPGSLREAGAGLVERIEQRMASVFTSYGVVPYGSVLVGVRIE
jgi:hypothetical protein